MSTLLLKKMEAQVQGVFFPDFYSAQNKPVLNVEVTFTIKTGERKFSDGPTTPKA
jgi:hypothetical protein